MVGVAGFEPTAPRSQSECATKLRHTPLLLMVSVRGRGAIPGHHRGARRAPASLVPSRPAGHAGVAQW